jgi:hypothetical protein
MLDRMSATRITIAGIPIPDKATVPGYVRPNFCDYIRDSRFET